MTTGLCRVVGLTSQFCLLSFRYATLVHALSTSTIASYNENATVGHLIIPAAFLTCSSCSISHCRLRASYHILPPLLSPSTAERAYSPTLPVLLDCANSTARIGTYPVTLIHLAWKHISTVPGWSITVASCCATSKAVGSSNVLSSAADLSPCFLLASTRLVVDTALGHLYARAVVIVPRFAV